MRRTSRMPRMSSARRKHSLQTAEQVFGTLKSWIGWGR